MPFPPTLGTDPDTANSGFVSTFEAYLFGQQPDFPPANLNYLAGFLGFVGGVGSSDSPLPAPPVPNYGPIGEPTIGAAGNPFPPVIGADPDASNANFVASYQAYLAPGSDNVLFISRLAGGFDLSDPVAGSLVPNPNSDPGPSYLQLDGLFAAFVGQPDTPFATTRLPRLAFGPFLNLAGLTYQVELDAFAKFGLSQIQYRIYASGQPVPPYNQIALSQNSFTTNLIATIGSTFVNLRAEAILTDSFGNVASQSVVLPGLPDTPPPTAPDFLYIAQIQDARWILVWDASTDNVGVDHYEIDQVDAAGHPLAILATGVQQNFFLSASNLAGNAFRVLAYDLAGNASASSPIVQAVANEKAGPVVRNVIAIQQPGADAVSVSWQVTPLGSPCSAVVVDADDQAISPMITAVNGQATLSLNQPNFGIFRVKVTPA